MLKRAFTLIELLVVIAIIAILAAILFPVFAAAKESAKATQVLAQMKQIGTAMYMYGTDYDDMFVKWVVGTGQPRNGFYRDDLLSWPQALNPYTKNGMPNRSHPNVATGGRVDPTGLNQSSMWTEEKWKAGADKADCDGLGALNSWVPVRWIHSHYGIGFGAVYGAGTLADPLANMAGSAATTGATMSMTYPARIAETIIITDGFTGTIAASSSTGPSFGTTMGCEASNMYKGGGNAIFTDSHAKFIKGNNERYLMQNAAGLWVRKYHYVAE